MRRTLLFEHGSARVLFAMVDREIMGMALGGL
jgi:hypothetical protein